jgi:two-component system response regulator HydG
MQKILIIEDNDTIRAGIEETLQKAGFSTTALNNGKAALAQLVALEPDCIITDLKMDEMDGIQVLQKARESRPELPVIIITAFGTIEKAVEAMKLGAYDFITKPFPPELLRVKVKQALEVAQISRDREKLYYENQYLRSEEQDRFPSRELLGNSNGMKSLLDQIHKVARTDASVFVMGESGTGKELVARAIHMNSSRHDKPFIKVNCAALAEGVLESELFGHERGAFTGALRRRPGRFELADQGTLFLDEIGEIHHSIQLKLLRVLQEREFERVGGTTTLKVDVRIISATNKNLQERVEQGSFREDLYYRLVIVPMTIPPLRDRRDDIPLLVNAIMHRLEKKHRKGIKKITPKALETLQRYAWPGNIRELENLLEQLYIFCEGDTLDIDNLPNFLKNSPSSGKMALDLGLFSLPEILDQTELQLLQKAIQQAGGIKTRMAKILGIKTSALYYKLEKYGLLNELKKDQN